MNKKICVNCKIKKWVNEFYVDKKHSDGRASRCKKCLNEARRSQYNTNSEKYLEAVKRWAKANPEKRKEYSKFWIKNNKKYVKEYRVLNAPKIRKQIQQWAKDNPEKVKEIEKRRYLKRYSTPIGRLNYAMRGSIWRVLCGAKAGRKWESLVGYTVEQLKRHLEKNFQIGMSWGNYGFWHVDHKIPIAVFNYKKVEDLDFRKCWALSNLQPMWGKENISKRAKLNKPFQPSLALGV